MVPRDVCRNDQHELTPLLGKALQTEAPYVAHFLTPVRKPSDHDTSHESSQIQLPLA